MNELLLEQLVHHLLRDAACVEGVEVLEGGLHGLVVLLQEGLDGAEDV